MAERMRTLIVRVPPWLHAELQSAAEADGRSVSSYVREVLKREVAGASR